MKNMDRILVLLRTLRFFPALCAALAVAVPTHALDDENAPPEIVNICDEVANGGWLGSASDERFEVAVTAEDPVVVAPDGSDFLDGHGVVIFGAGEPHELAPPPAPEFELVGDLGENPIKMQYRLVAVTEQMGHTAAGRWASVDAPARPTGENYIKVFPAREPGSADDKNRPVRPNGPALFESRRVTNDEIKKLNDGQVPDRLRRRFDRSGRALPNDADLLVRRQREGRWLIVSVHGRHVGQRYVVLKTGGKLRVHAAPYQYLVYGKREEASTEEPFRLFGAIVAEAFRSGLWKHLYFADRPTIFTKGPRGNRRAIREGGEPLDDAEVPEFIPYVAPADAGNDGLRTRIEVGEPGALTLTLLDPPGATLVDALMVHDNSRVVQEALDGTTAGRIHIPPGNYQMYGNVYVNRKAAVQAGLLGDAKMLFHPGFGCVVRAEGAVFENIVLYGAKRWQHSLPAGGLFISNDGIHGAGVLVLRPTEWRNCRTSGFAGSGHAIWGHYNANKTYLDGCISSKNTGHGFYASSGQNANQIVWFRCNAVGNGGWGIYDSGFLGNHMIGCHAAANSKGPYLVEDSTAFSTIIGCYSEGGQPPSYVKDRTVVIGGDHGAGFDESSQGFRMLTNFSVSPFRVQSRPTGADAPYTIDVGWLNRLLGFASKAEPVNHYITWERRDHDTEGASWKKPFQRLRFRAEKGIPGMLWCQGELRGSGMFVFPRGFLLGHGARDSGVERERRLFGLAGEPKQSPDNRGTYDKGDVIIDLSGKDYWFRPTESFGFGTDWQPGLLLQIGDTIEPTDENANGYVYVLRGFVDADTGTPTPEKRKGSTGASEPDWDSVRDVAPDDQGEPVFLLTSSDGEIIWQRWGSNTAQYETFGRRTVRQRINVGRIGPGETWTTAIIVDGAQWGDTVVATPLVTPRKRLPDGVVWNAHVNREREGEVTLRITNVHPTKTRTVRRMKWTVDCWKH